MKAIINGKIILEDCILDTGVVIFDKNIKSIISTENFKRTSNDNIEIIDAKGNFVSPGFIDIHIHGAGGHDAMDGTLEDLNVISKSISEHGITGFLPTTMTMDKTKIHVALDAVKTAMNSTLTGAKVLGAHMEGPFISEKYKGAQKKDYILKPNIDFIKGYEEVIKIITLAPEEDEDFKFIKWIKANTNITLSIGHTNADYSTAMEAIKNGITHATHMFNAMTPLNHREPGVVGAIMKSFVSAELIADKIHVNPAIFQILVDVKGKDELVLISDSMRAACMEDGISELGGQKVFVKNNSARLEDGTLAGSILTLEKAVKNVYENTSLKLYEAVALASSNPSKEINIYKHKGSITQGKDADMVIFDKNFNVIQTIVEGNIVYTKLEP
ncbi:N-acetylglucosamine-6-phosphate deacetylase [Clostridium akagii]|uniref:N-acetylglucosamine-6-phosphate deacetylase n=1 Tax=Clostridium akagii TaxID=91623 RepID=UPI000479DDE7|nr:N-acetylglucosamine-6-phosphate deacetylase [Clostridium akagii]